MCIFEGRKNAHIIRSPWPSHANTQPNFGVFRMAQPRRTLMVFEKPSQIRTVFPHWQDQHPNDIISCFYTPPMGSFRFRIPRDLPLSGVPFIADPELQRRPFGDLSDQSTSIFDGDFGAMARDADHIVCATDFDPAGCRNFLDIMAYYGVQMPLSDITWLALHAGDPASVKAGIAKDLRADHPDLTRLADFGYARQYFDNQYLLNALPMFGRTLKLAGITPDGELDFLSKYTLQMLLLLARSDQGPFNERALFRLMQDNPASKGTSPLGSPLSRFKILSWLIQNDCLVEVECVLSQGEERPALYQLSHRGRELASLIHKDCYDPHLCKRLDGWGEEWPVSKPAIDRYIRTFFGKQKRYLASKG
jgi:hypothetical protein